MRRATLTLLLAVVGLLAGLWTGAAPGLALPSGSVPPTPTATPPATHPATGRQAGGVILPPLPPSPVPGGQPVTVAGVLTVVYGDHDHLVMVTDPGNAAIRTAVFLSEPVAEAGGGIVRLQRKRVTVTGVPAATSYDGAPTIIASSVRLAPLQSLATATAAGAQPFAVLLCRFPDQPTVQHDPSWYTTLMGNTPGALDHYFRDVSYGNINLTGSVIGSLWRTLPNAMSYYGNGTNNLASLKLYQLAQDCVNLFSAEFTYTGVVGVQIVTNGAVFATAWGGTATLTLGSATRTVGVTWFNRQYSEYASVWQHEMGHAFGLSHSGSDTGIEYMDAYDVMGYGYYDAPAGQPYIYWGQHTIAAYKAQLGWIPPARIFTYTGGSQTITLDRLGSSDTGNYLYAKVPVAAGGARYFTLEARKKVGSYENQLPVGAAGAVIIHEVDETRAVPAYVQGNGASGTGNFTAAAAYQWTVGRTFAAMAANVLISVSAATTNGFTVTITPNTTGCAFDEYEPNAPPAARTPLSVGASVSGLLCPSGDEDHYELSAQAGVPYTVTLTNLAANLDLHLLSTNDSVLASSTNSGTANESLTYTPGSAATLVVRVRGASGSFHPTQFYALLVSTPAAGGVTAESAWTSDGSADFTVQKTVYATGEPIRYVARVANTTGTAQSVRFVWQVSGPGGVIVNAVNDPISTPSGTVLWGLNTAVPAAGGRAAMGLLPVQPAPSLPSAPLIPLGAPAGAYTFTFSVTFSGQTSTRTATFTVLAALDTNRDGQVTIDDSLCVARAVAGLPASATCPDPLNNPDVNGDGAVSAVDALCLARYVGGMNATAACPLTPPTPARGPAPPAAGGTAPGAGGAAVRFDPATLALAPGGEGAVSLRAAGDARAGIRIGGWTIDLVYDPARVRVLACTSTVGLCNAAYAPGVLRIAGTSLTGLEPDAVLATVRFQATGPLRTSSGLGLRVERLLTPAGSPLAARVQEGIVTIIGGR